MQVTCCSDKQFIAFQILSYFHKHKTQKGVDAMLLRLYEPILWRSLKVNVPTPSVRTLALRYIYMLNSL